MTSQASYTQQWNPTEHTQQNEALRTQINAVKDVRLQSHWGGFDCFVCLKSGPRILKNHEWL